MVKKKAPLRVGETHVQAVRDTFPGAVLDAGHHVRQPAAAAVVQKLHHIGQHVLGHRFDLFGLRAQGLPDERRLVLPDDWPADLYPLRKDSMDYRKKCWKPVSKPQ